MLMMAGRWWSTRPQHTVGEDRAPDHAVGGGSVAVHPQQHPVGAWSHPTGGVGDEHRQRAGGATSQWAGSQGLHRHVPVGYVMGGVT